MNYQLRALDSKDMDAVTKLFMSAYDDEVWSEKWQPEEAYNRINEIISSPEAFALVYVEDNEILGCILCTLMSWHTGKQLELREFFVSPSHQNRGIGGMLMKQLEASVSELGVSELFLWTKNDPKLVNFYKKIGYGVVEDTIQMAKKF